MTFVCVRVRACVCVLSAQVGLHLREGLPVERHGGQLRLHQDEGGGLHQQVRAGADLGRGWLRLPVSGPYAVRACEGAAWRLNPHPLLKA